MEEITKRKVATSFLWSLLEKFGSQGLQFVLSIILARILDVKDYGLIALIMVFIQIANVFVIDGFNTALIQKKDSDELDFDSVFWFSSAISVLLYLIFFFSSPYIAAFYDEPKLISVIRIFSLQFFYTPLQSCQYAYISKHLMFKVYVLRSFICLLVSGVVAIFMAKLGYGVFALVAQQLIYGTLNSILLSFFISWHPKFQLSFERLKSLVSFGWKFVATGLLENIFKNIYSLFIPKVYDINQLSFYNRGQQFPKLIAENFINSLRGVLFPSFSAKNDDPETVKNMLRRSCQVNAYILMPLLFGMAAVSDSMVLVLLTEKWSEAVPFLQLCCLYFAFYYLNATNMSAINAMGYSGVYLKYEIIKKIIICGALAATIPLGVKWMVLGQVVTGLISSILNAFPSKKYLNYGFKEQFKDVTGSLLLSAVMAVPVYFIFVLNKQLGINFNNFIILVLQILAGIVIYVAGSFIFKLSGFSYIISVLKKAKTRDFT